jgi:hypothetical protein
MHPTGLYRVLTARPRAALGDGDDTARADQ